MKAQGTRHAALTAIHGTVLNTFGTATSTQYVDQFSRVMSNTRASPRSCDSGELRMLQDSEAPYFAKTMTHVMLQKIDRVILPMDFIRTHGHMLETAISLTGPNGLTHAVSIKTYDLWSRSRQPGRRHYLSHGWVEFVQENGFQTGHLAVFKLVGFSRFHVLVSTSLRELEKAVPAFETPPQSFSNSDEESGPDNAGGRKAGGMVSQAPLHRNVPKNQATTDCRIDVTCDCGVVRTSQDSEAPCFGKTMMHLMLQKMERLVIPLLFVRTHGHMLDTAISLTGPNGQARSVELRVRSPYPRGEGPHICRLYLGPGWREFVKENAIQTGDRVVFKLIGNSCFHVLVSAQQSPPQLCKCGGEKRGLDSAAKRNEDGIVSQARKVAANQATTDGLLPECKLSFNPAKLDFQPWLRPAPKTIAVMQHPYLREADYFKYPGLDAAICSNCIVPRFITKLAKTNLAGHDQRLELPYHFAQEHGRRFKMRVLLRGPSGRWRIAKLRLSSPARMCVFRARLERILP